MSIYEDIFNEEYQFLKLNKDDYQGNFSYLEDLQLFRRYNLGYWHILGILDEYELGVEYKNRREGSPELNKWHANALADWIYHHDFGLVKIIGRELTDRQLILVIHYLLNWNSKLYFTEYKKVIILIEELVNRR
jgi:hypothetical protein